MVPTLLLTLLAGLLAGNAVPHLVKGLTRERFPTPFGGSPVVNVVAGWAMVNLAGLHPVWADLDRFPRQAWIAGSLGVLAIALFHARIGAFGRMD
ncbi:hypothetical protein EV384_1547 [Micromonospora kangleipakensis]|uniref:PQ loop repeat protein n=1 Tax=Micromonospora kangleipakensis TaxID=1077942 RepID=A0A4Q8B6Y2_9ACTN|nr:hypothetical protein [Micromonospora kangleipakensis]RZU73148.1 hypothetical protein EV384_1547 [Micromonospora kangleipakensis]